MSLFGTKRGRNGRGATLRLAGEPATDLRSLLSDRAVVSRLALGFVTVAALAVSVQAWKHAFPFRLGQRPVDGVAAVIDFQRTNRERTARARDRAAEQVPPVFRHDPRSIARAPQELRAALASLLAAPDLGSLAPETRRAFGLAAEANQPPAAAPAGDREEAFQRLKQIAGDEQQLRELVASFAKFLQPLEKTGLIRPEHVTGEVTAAAQIAVADADGERRMVNLSEVQLQTLLAPTGLLHSRWALFPTLLPVRAE
ncbi:MAG TPA: hypothetical protein VKU82_04105, partial [Planctomycetaceae bacterium]|nr:hypothetical protein [Planctomycetaceae bacterium]